MVNNHLLNLFLDFEEENMLSKKEEQNLSFLKQLLSYNIEDCNLSSDYIEIALGNIDYSVNKFDKEKMYINFLRKMSFNILNWLGIGFKGFLADKNIKQKKTSPYPYGCLYAIIIKPTKHTDKKEAYTKFLVKSSYPQDVIEDLSKNEININYCNGPKLSYFELYSPIQLTQKAILLLDIFCKPYLLYKNKLYKIKTLINETRLKNIVPYIKDIKNSDILN